MSGHVPVMPDSVMRSLALRPGETYADCTAGLGGHALLAAQAVGQDGCVILNDLDRNNLRLAEEAIAGRCRVETVHGNFAELPAEMARRGLRADAVLADLGFASVHVDRGERGFSFMRDGPLDMRYDQAGTGRTAAELVASASEEELASMLREFGEERRARAVAQKLVRARQAGPIQTTSELAELVRSVVPRSRGAAIDPATRTFQALRIAVNDEFGSLSALLAAVRYDGAAWLRPGARVGIISFHSLEDRLVKRGFAELVAAGRGEALTGKPAEASTEEVQANPRARSAKLRVVRWADN